MALHPSNRADAVRLLHTSAVWERKGHTRMAMEGYVKASRLDPDFAEPYHKLANLMLKLGEVTDAVRYYDEVLRVSPGDANAVVYRKRLLQLLGRNTNHGAAGERTSAGDVSSGRGDRDTAPPGALNLGGQQTFSFHRSGWSYAIQALRPLHHPAGIHFDGFIEQFFAWQHKFEPRPARVLLKMQLEGTFDSLATSEERGIVPYRKPWVGVLHNPHHMPPWFHYDESPQSIFAKDIWKRSLDSCLGLFTFSEHTAQWLRTQTGKPVSSLIHPTELPSSGFDFEHFLRNPRKQILQIGWWLRKLNAIYQLPLGASNPLGYRKVRLVPQFIADADVHLRRLMEKERQALPASLDSRWADNTREAVQVSNEDYDRLLSENIVFVQLHDANANNVVIECIARGTPLLINPLPAVVEYLGPDYPLYYSSLEEAACKALDLDLLRCAHCYLMTCRTRSRLSADHFLQQFKDSDVYRGLLAQG